MEVDKDVHDIKNTLTKMGLRLEIVYNCLVGNEISKDGGLIADILGVKNEMSTILKRVEAVESNEKKRSIYVKILWGVAGAIVVIILNHYIKL